MGSCAILACPSLCLLRPSPSSIVIHKAVEKVWDGGRRAELFMWGRYQEEGQATP